MGRVVGGLGWEGRGLEGGRVRGAGAPSLDRAPARATADNRSHPRLPPPPPPQRAGPLRALWGRLGRLPCGGRVWRRRILRDPPEILSRLQTGAARSLCPRAPPCGRWGGGGGGGGGGRRGRARRGAPAPAAAGHTLSRTRPLAPPPHATRPPPRRPGPFFLHLTQTLQSRFHRSTPTTWPTLSPESCAARRRATTPTSWRQALRRGRRTTASPTSRHGKGCGWIWRVGAAGGCDPRANGARRAAKPATSRPPTPPPPIPWASLGGRCVASAGRGAE